MSLAWLRDPLLPKPYYNVLLSGATVLPPHGDDNIIKRAEPSDVQIIYCRADARAAILRSLSTAVFRGGASVH